MLIFLIWINDHINDNPTNETAKELKKTLSLSNLLRSPRQRRSRKSQRREEERQVRRGNPTMRGIRASSLLLFGVVLIQLLAAQTDAQGPKSKWQTLTGKCSHFLSSCIKNITFLITFLIYFALRACQVSLLAWLLVEGFPDCSQIRASMLTTSQCWQVYPTSFYGVIFSLPKMQLGSASLVWQWATLLLLKLLIQIVQTLTLLMESLLRAGSPLTSLWKILAKLTVSLLNSIKWMLL